MSDDVVRQHQLFWVYLRNEGKCSICGEPVSPEEAAVVDAVLPIRARLSELEMANLAHTRCIEEAEEPEDILRAA